MTKRVIEKWLLMKNKKIENMTRKEIEALSVEELKTI
jgi:hypothetical protein